MTCPWCGRIEGMARKIETQDHDLESGAGKRERKSSKKVDSPTSFVEGLVTLFKLKFVKKSVGIEGVDKDSVIDLEERLNDPDAEVKSGAEGELRELFKKALEIDEVSSRDVTLESVLKSGGETRDEVVGLAKMVDERLPKIRELGETAVNKDIEALETNLLEIAEKTEVEVIVDEAQAEQRMQELFQQHIGVTVDQFVQDLQQKFMDGSLKSSVPQA